MHGTSSSSPNQADSMTPADIDNNSTRERKALGIGKKIIQKSNDRCDPAIKDKEMAAISPDNVRGDTWRTPSSSMELKKICQKNARSIADESLINRVMDALQKNQPLSNKFPPMMLASIGTRLITLMANQPLLRENPSSQFWFAQHRRLIMQQVAGLEGGIEQAMQLIESEGQKVMGELLANQELTIDNNVDDKTKSTIMEAMELLAAEEAIWWMLAAEQLDNSEQENVSEDDAKILMHKNLHGENPGKAVQDVCNKHQYNHESKSLKPRPKTPRQELKEKERERNKG